MISLRAFAMQAHTSIYTRARAHTHTHTHMSYAFTPQLFAGRMIALRSEFATGGEEAVEEYVRMRADVSACLCACVSVCVCVRVCVCVCVCVQECRMKVKDW